MCEVKKTVSVKDVKDQLKKIMSYLNEDEGPVQATLVMDDNYRSVTAILAGKVFCVNLMI